MGGGMGGTPSVVTSPGRREVIGGRCGYNRGGWMSLGLLFQDAYHARVRDDPERLGRLQREIERRLAARAVQETSSEEGECEDFIQRADGSDRAHDCEIAKHARDPGLSARDPRQQFGEAESQRRGGEPNV